MRIEVTERDIRLGMKDIVSNTQCPVARAMRRAGFKKILVGASYVSTDPYSVQTEVNLPKKVSGIIRDMCGRIVPKPFSFTLTKKQVLVLNPKFYRA